MELTIYAKKIVRAMVIAVLLITLELARIGSLHFITCRFSERLNGLLITR